MKQFSKEILEATIKEFELVGFKVNAGVANSDLIKRANELFDYYPNPYEAIYIAFGDSKGYNPEIYFSNNCWHFDLESMNGEGSYIKILKNINRISNNDIAFDAVEDYCNTSEDDQAWVSFTFKGEKFKWDLKVDDDWIDGSLFDKIQSLFKKYNTKGRLTFFPEGQSFVTSYLTPEQFEIIKQKTRLKIEWLEGKGQIY